MKFEKPISTIRKAVNELGKRNAENESLQNPEARHYNEAIASYKRWRSLDAEELKIAIKINAEEHDLREKIGDELVAIFNTVWEEVNKNAKPELLKAEQQLRMKNISQENYHKEFEELDEKFLLSNAEQVKKDARIINTFSGKEDLLQNAINLTVNLMREYIEYKRKK